MWGFEIQKLAEFSSQMLVKEINRRSQLARWQWKDSYSLHAHYLSLTGPYWQQYSPHLSHNGPYAAISPHSLHTTFASEHLYSEAIVTHTRGTRPLHWPRAAFNLSLQLHQRFIQTPVAGHNLKVQLLCRREIETRRKWRSPVVPTHACAAESIPRVIQSEGFDPRGRGHWYTCL